MYIIDNLFYCRNFRKLVLLKVFSFNNKSDNLHLKMKKNSTVVDLIRHILAI